MTRAANKQVLQVAREVAATLGNEFFHALAKHLAAALSTDCLIIGEFAGGKEERCRTVGAWMGNAPADFDYALAGSAAAQAALGKPILCRLNAQTRFPTDTLLLSVGAHACIGVPLINQSLQPVGVLMALFRRPIPSVKPSQDLLEFFAPRASAELSRKQEEDQLRESDQRYRAFISRNSDAMWRVEFDPPVPVALPEKEQLDLIRQSGYLAECNDALARLLGRERAEQLIGCGLEEVVPFSDPGIRDATLIAIRSGHQLSYLETNPTDAQGHCRHMLRSQWGIIENGKLERIWGCNRDITDLKRAETALDASEQRMTDILEAMHLLVFLIDPDGLIVFCNQYFYRLTGWLREDLAGKSWLAKLIPEEQHSRLETEFALGALNPDVPIHFENTLLAADGGRRQLVCDSTLLRGESGEISARAIIGRDVTEQKALEHDLRKAQKLAAIGRVAGGVAHDFNNLLAVILGYSSGLIDKLQPSDISYEGLLEIRKAAEKGADLSRSLLTFSKRQVLRPKTFPVNSLIEESQPMLAALMGPGIELITDLDPDAGYARIDGGYFHQVLLNLAINARDAMPNGGRFTVTTSPTLIQSAQPHAAGVPPGEYVQLTVSDTGIGITEEVREHLFEPFFTTKQSGKGTGLGLSTVYGIVSQSGGYILVDTEVGHGSTFRIYLPRVEEEVAPPPNLARSLEMPRGAETILLVNDGDAARPLTATILRDLGYTVMEAAGTSHAMDFIRQQASAIDLLLVEVGSADPPVEELVDRVKKLRPQIKVLLASGSGATFMPKEAGMGFGYLQKPFAPLALAIKVRELLDER